ncbi:hypothetical protein BKA70DRAFT_1424353 [Coprinopsis sp. MPI-PUGE-AT-0042]|nr:hypothetical protein BKA70DRAFT_1424353 [Coprinopsis sp. MPI-PUGE-AT-0042]
MPRQAVKNQLPDFLWDLFSAAVKRREDTTLLYFAPYFRLLQHLFGPQDQFDITVKCFWQGPQSLEWEKETLLVVTHDQEPVFFLQLRPFYDGTYDVRRKKADQQMHTRFKIMFPNNRRLTSSRVSGISVFGAHMCLCEYDRVAGRASPPPIRENPASVESNSMESATRWTENFLLDRDGACYGRLREVVQRVIRRCQG